MQRSSAILLVALIAEIACSSSQSLDASPDGCDVRTTRANDTALDKKQPLFPPDPFTLQQKRYGLVALHVLGVTYAFVALAIVCDEFFAPALEAIVERLDVTPDVAGATFMAAGGSAPEFFASVMGAFVSFDDVGTGTVVGSAAFNVLAVVGACAIFSGDRLTLAWWPLVRDCAFYAVALVAFVSFLRDGLVELHEAAVLATVYVAYATFMKWNRTVEVFVKSKILCGNMTRVGSSDQLMPTQDNGGINSRCGRRDSTTSAKFRRGLLQLMMQTLDPMHNDKVDDKAVELHALASLKALLDATRQNHGASSAAAAKNLRSLTASSYPTNIDVNGEKKNSTSFTKNAMVKTEDDDDEGDNKPLDLSWPETTKSRLFYIFTLPIILPLWLTLPDTRSERGRKFFVITFIGSIIWLAFYSYLMVWWANVVGETLFVPSEVMGLTFLAAGISVPNLITKVMVARKGYGDMAMSSSVGSNIFDITIGLPFPWILYNIIFGCPVKVNSTSMTCCIATLFLMLIFVVLSIACFGWQLNNSLGYTMFILYVLFVIFSVLVEYHIIRCPF